MTDKQRVFPPKKLVPVNESIIVHWGGKPPKVSTREFNGERITEVTWWFGIADRNYPDLVGQYHPFCVRPWISPPRQVTDENGQPKTVQGSKLYKTILALKGQEMADKFAWHDASLNFEDPNLTDEERQKAIPPDTWKEFRGFYVAVFKEPRRDKETGQFTLADDGGLKRQEIVELKPLKAARIYNDEQLKANIIWPPPETEEKPAQPAQPPQQPANSQKPAGLGLPAKAAGQPSPATTETKPQGEVPAAVSPVDQMTIPDIIASMKVMVAKPAIARVANRFRTDKGKATIPDLADADLRLLFVLLQIEDQMANGKSYADTREQLLKTWGKLYITDLTYSEAVLMLGQLEQLADTDVPF